MFDTMMNVLVFGGVALVFVFAIVLYARLHRDPTSKQRRRILDQESKDNWRGW